MLNTALKRHFKQLVFFLWQGGWKKSTTKKKKSRELLGKKKKKVQPPVWRSNVPSAGGTCLPGVRWDRLLTSPVRKTAPTAQPPQPTPGSQNDVNPPEPRNGNDPGSSAWAPTPTALLPQHRLMAQCPPNPCPSLSR